MLYNLPILATEELQQLFISEGQRFISLVDQKSPSTQLKEVAEHLHLIMAELTLRNPSRRQSTFQ
jgi:hypothetical protein